MRAALSRSTAEGSHNGAAEIHSPLHSPGTQTPVVMRHCGRFGAVSKTVVGLTVHRGFESLPLRSTSRIPALRAGLRHVRGPCDIRRRRVSAGQRRPCFARFRSPDVPPRAMLEGAPGASYGLTAMELEGIAPTEEHHKHWAKVFAFGVRNGVEDLHAGGAFDDGQAPLLNRLMRRYIYEALLALRYLDPERPDDPFFAYLSELVDDWATDDPYEAVMPGAVSRAIWEFAECAGIDEAAAEELEEAAITGCLGHVHLLARADEPDARAQLSMALAMVPSYWEDPDVSDDFRGLLQTYGRRR
jgi:hypothetical protein